jgi:xanthine/CO dehydrogenase XdhC/CoxF family maturation factor
LFAVKHWLESRLVWTAIGTLHQHGIAAALATVVRVRGSAYRHEGAKMVVGADGTIVGNVSGGCLEQDVREVARRVLTSGVAERRRYCSGNDEIAAWDLGVGCEGEVEILVAPVHDDYAAERAALGGEVPFVVYTPLTGGMRRIVSASGTTGLMADADGVEWFAEAFSPPPQLLLCGAGDDAIPLARMAVDLGFRVTVTDRRPGLLEPARFVDGVRLVQALPDALESSVSLDGDTFAVVMTHHFADDGAYLATLLSSAVAYIGMLGPRQRTERLLGLVALPGVEDDVRVHGPVGLDIGTDGAEQVALSVLAEIMATRAGRPATPLRERMQPIHADRV